MLVDHRTVAVTSVVAGVVLGVVDFVWIKYLPAPWGDLGNSPAVWAVAAFVLGHWVRVGWLRAAVAASVLLVVAVPSYYLAAVVIQGDDLQVLWMPFSLLWMCFGVLAGVVFGIGGTWARRSGWQQIVGTALPGAVLWGEAGMLLRRGRPDDLWTALLVAALGVLAILIVGRTGRQRLAALAVAVPLALLGFLAYLGVGTGGPR